ncbi:MAG: hypothetical protein ACMG6S_12160, partial [Byssovorax sp.]
YECLSGKRPFDARNYNALLVQILTSAPRSLRELEPDVPPALERIVEKALIKSPDNRYQSALDIQSALRAVNLVEATTSKMPAKRRAMLASDPTGDDPDGTFVFSRAAMGLCEGEPTSERSPAASERWPVASERSPVTPKPPVAVVTIPRPVDSETATTGVYLPFTDDDNERTTVDEPAFLHDTSASASKRDTIPMPPRKE